MNIFIELHVIQTKKRKVLHIGYVVIQNIIFVLLTIIQSRNFYKQKILRRPAAQELYVCNTYAILLR